MPDSVWNSNSRHLIGLQTRPPKRLTPRLPEREAYSTRRWKSGLTGVMTEYVRDARTSKIFQPGTEHYQARGVQRNI